jgi:hypothetical protein
MMIYQNDCKWAKTDGIFVIDYLNVHYSEDHFVYNERK